jgi:hypothetical protein
MERDESSPLTRSLLQEKAWNERFLDEKAVFEHHTAGINMSKPREMLLKYGKGKFPPGEMVVILGGRDFTETLHSLPESHLGSHGSRLSRGSLESPEDTTLAIA